MHITYIYDDYKKIRVMHRGLPWTDVVSAESVSQWRLWDLLLHKNLLLVLLDDLLELAITGGHDLRQLVLYMHAMMMMQQFSI